MKIHNAYSAPIALGFVTLAPGQSADVPDMGNAPSGKPWVDAIRDSSVFASGAIREGEAPKALRAAIAPQAPDVADLRGMTPHQAYEKIGSENTLHAIQQWAQTETREDVLGWLRQRANELMQWGGSSAAPVAGPATTGGPDGGPFGLQTAR